ncbi:MAG: hypothetical protein ABI353_18185 [Isosphaeraceae bacterium]
MRRLLVVLVFGLNLGTGTARADFSTIGSFITNGGSQAIELTNLGTSATLSTQSGGLPILFTYQGLAGLPADLQGAQAAHLFLDLTTTEPAHAPPGLGLAIQPFTTLGTLTIERDTPAAEGFGDRRTLLAFTFTGTLLGSLGGQQLSLQAQSLLNEVSASSDFLNVDGASLWSMSLSIGPVDPAVAIVDSFLSGFQAGSTGLFATTAPPVPVPCPPSLLLTIFGALSLAGMPLLRPRRLAMG